LGPEEVYLPRPLPTDLDQAVQEALIEANDLSRPGLAALNRYTGMRVGEMRDLSLKCEWRLRPRYLHPGRVPIGKTRTERLIPLDARAVALNPTHYRTQSRLPGRKGGVPPCLPTA